MSQALLLESPQRIEPDSDERYTPTALFKRLTAGVALELDASATAESTKCPRFYTAADNGLAQPWDAPTWSNPPYSDIEPWVVKAGQEVMQMRCPVAYQLLPSWTDREWWLKYVEPHRDGRGANIVETHFLRGRHCFGTPGDPEGVRGLAGRSPQFWLVLLIWRLKR